LVNVKRIKSYDCKFPSFHTAKTQNKEQERIIRTAGNFLKKIFFFKSVK